MVRLSQSIATILLGVKCWACALSLVRFVLVAIEQVVNPELGGCLPFTLISSTIVQMVSLVWMGHLDGPFGWAILKRDNFTERD